MKRILIIFTIGVIILTACKNTEPTLNWKVDSQGDSTVTVKSVTLKKLKAKFAIEMIEHYRNEAVVILDPGDNSFRSTLFADFTHDFVRALTNYIMRAGDRFTVVTAAYLQDDPQGRFHANEPTIIIRTQTPGLEPNYYTPSRSELCPLPHPCP